MLEPGANWGYVAAAYGATVVILGALVLWSLLGARRSRAALDALERRRTGAER